jgi:hypothetical protein
MTTKKPTKKEYTVYVYHSQPTTLFIKSTSPSKAARYAIRKYLKNVDEKLLKFTVNVMYSTYVKTKKMDKRVIRTYEYIRKALKTPKTITKGVNQFQVSYDVSLKFLTMESDIVYRHGGQL